MLLGSFSLKLRAPSSFPPKRIMCSFHFRLRKSQTCQISWLLKAPAMSSHLISSPDFVLPIQYISPCPFSCIVKPDDGGCAWAMWSEICLQWHLVHGLVKGEGHGATMKHRHALSWDPVFERDFQNFFSGSLLPRPLPVTGLLDPLHYHTKKVLGLEYQERSSLQRLQKT